MRQVLSQVWLDTPSSTALVDPTRTHKALQHTSRPSYRLVGPSLGTPGLTRINSSQTTSGLDILQTPAYFASSTAEHPTHSQTPSRH